MAAWIRTCTEVQACLDGLGLAVTAAFDSSLEWAADGARSAASWVVDNTGVARTSAGALLKTSRLARTMDHVSAAATAGELCADKVHWLTRARRDDVAELFDRDEAFLVGLATKLAVDALRVRLLAWRYRALEELGRNEPDGPAPIPDGEADRLNLHATIGGRGLVDGELDPASRAVLFGAVSAEIDTWFRNGDLNDDSRSRAELNAKALLEIVRRGSAAGTEHGGPRPLIIALADLATLADLGLTFDLGSLDPASIDLSNVDLTSADTDGLDLTGIDLNKLLRTILAALTPRPAGPRDGDPGHPGGGAGGSDDPSDPSDPDDPSEPSDPDDPDDPSGLGPDDGPGGPGGPVGPAGHPSTGPGNAGPVPTSDRVGPAPPGETGPDQVSSEPGAGAGAGAGPDPGAGSNGRPRSDQDSRAGPSPLGPRPPPGPAPAASCPTHGTTRADAPNGTRRCEIVGVGPVPVDTLRRLLDDIDIDIAPVVLGFGGVPVLVGRRRRLRSRRDAGPFTLPVDPKSLDLGRAQRLASNPQWIALLARSSGTCEIPGCTVPYHRCEVHHRRYWTSQGHTDLDNLIVACGHHHHTLHADFTAVPMPHTGHFELHRPDGSPVHIPCHDRPLGDAGG